jgi:branched-subunit amino acid transport protein
MSAATAWAVVLLAGAGSYLLRIAAVAAHARFTPPAWVERASAWVMPAAFAGLAAGSLSQRLGGEPREGVPLLLAALVTVAVARRWSANQAVLAGVTVLAAGLLVSSAV